jgi:dsRNA-specific ribonuclease
MPSPDSTAPATVPVRGLFIDGAERPASSSELIDVFDPSRGEVIARIGHATDDDVDAAVQSARRAFSSGPWATMTVRARARLVNRLADALEAVIGAVFLDAGFDAAQSLVLRLFDQVDMSPTTLAAAKDPKTELQEWLQARRWQLPLYRVVGTTGAAHQQTFDVECEVPELKQSQRGIGSSRRSGEQAAALAMLQWLRENPL